MRKKERTCSSVVGFLELVEKLLELPVGHVMRSPRWVAERFKVHSKLHHPHKRIKGKGKGKEGKGKKNREEGVGKEKGKSMKR